MVELQQKEEQLQQKDAQTRQLAAELLQQKDAELSSIQENSQVLITRLNLINTMLKMSAVMHAEVTY